MNNASNPPQFEEGSFDEKAVDELNAYMRVVYAAGTVTQQEFLRAEKQGSFDLISKSDGSPVTRVDYLTRDTIRREFEKENISGYHDDEEGEQGDRESEIKFVTDPVDGTQNLLLGLRGFFTNVFGKYEKNLLTVSIVNDPMNDELFLAGKGIGAWKFWRSGTSWNSRKLTMPELTPNVAGRPFLLTDTKVYEEDRTLAKTLEILGYRPEPVSGSGKKMSLLVSRPNVAGMFRSQRGNPDPHDIAAAALLVTEAGGQVTSLSGDTLLDNDLQFYDGYAFGCSAAHDDIIHANHMLKQLFARSVATEATISKQTSDDLAAEAANLVRSRTD